MSISFRTPTVLLALVVLAAGACADEPDDRKHSKEAEKTAEKMRGEIQAEIKTLANHPWAGDYYCGDGLGVNLSLVIAPKAGYVFEWHGCLGLYDRNYGAVSEKDGRLHLVRTFTNNPKVSKGIAPEWVPVAWGSRTYMIPADEMIRFCNAVNEGSEPHVGVHGSFLLRRGDEEKKASGLPAVPPKYRAYLLKEPINAEIVAVGRSITRLDEADHEFIYATVTVSVGKDRGLLPGMELYVTSPDVGVESVEITTVDRVKAEGIIMQAGEHRRRPQVGWKLSTRAPWNPVEDQAPAKK
jgi:hypothetical protein